MIEEIQEGIYILRQGGRTMSGKEKVAVYYRKTNNSRNVGVEQQKEMLKAAAVFSGNKVIEDYCDAGNEQEEGNTQFDKMLRDIKDNKIAAVTLLDRMESDGQEMEQLKKAASEAEIPLYVCEDDKVKRAD